MNFAIHKHIGGDWSIELADGTLSQLTWVEMLGELACLLMVGRQHLAVPIIGLPPLAAVYSLSVKEVEPGYYTVRRAAKFIDRLTCDEALGFLAAYTLTDGAQQLFTGLMTYEQWVERFRWRRGQQIDGLLAKQIEEFV